MTIDGMVDLPPMADQLKQVFLELMRNAVQAMDAGGCLRANTRLEAGVVVEIQDEL
jgi:signal transduction histidine kinase